MGLFRKQFKIPEETYNLILDNDDYCLLVMYLNTIRRSDDDTMNVQYTKQRITLSENNLALRDYIISCPKDVKGNHVIPLDFSKANVLYAYINRDYSELHYYENIYRQLGEAILSFKLV